MANITPQETKEKWQKNVSEKIKSTEVYKNIERSKSGKNFLDITTRAIDTANSWKKK